MKCLYFDLDGTVITENESRVKTALGNGILEKLIRYIKFDRIFFVGSIIEYFKGLPDFNQNKDGLQMVFDLCDGAFLDKNWFLGSVELIKNSEHRVKEINTEEDWWYIDDLAEYYCRSDEFHNLYDSHNGKRIFIPKPNDDGHSTIEWLKNI